MRERDNFVWVTTGTFAVHVAILVVIDIGGAYGRRKPLPPAPRVELVDIEVPPPPPPLPVAKIIEEEKPVELKRIRPVPQMAVPPPTVADVEPDDESGGAAVVVQMDVGTHARGVPVAIGKRTSERVGQGGTGTGTGAGAGAGTAPIPVSIATIKTQAKPRGNYDAYGADYPPEAKRLGIEGQIRVRLLVDATGKVVGRRVLPPGLGHGLDEAALARAAKFEFDPAVDTTGKPVASVVVWTFNFTLPE